MNNPNQLQQIKYQKIMLQGGGLLPVQINQLNHQFMAYQKIDQHAHNITYVKRTSQEYFGGITRGFVGSE